MTVFIFFPVFLFPGVRGLIFGVMLLASLIIEFNFCRNNRKCENISFLYLAVGSFLIGYLFWVLDDTKILCYPHSWFQAHSLWHLFSAVSGLMMYLYMDPISSKVKAIKSPH